MSDDKLISTEHLHTAASLAAMATYEEQGGFEKDAIFGFIDSSTFHPPMDSQSLAYGILVGVLAVKARDERNDDDGDGTVRAVRDNPGGA